MRALIIVALLFFAGIAEATELQWQPPKFNVDGTVCDDLAKYRVYYDTDASGPPYLGSGWDQGESGFYVDISSLNEPLNPAIVVSGFPADSLTYVVVTAIDDAGNESGFSNEITLGSETPIVVPPPDAVPMCEDLQALIGRHCGKSLPVDYSGLDVNGDGALSLKDYDLMRGRKRVDYSGDGVIEFWDYVKWKDDFDAYLAEVHK